MKKLITLTLLTSLTLTLFAQVRLDVTGNAKIRGNLDISNGSNLIIGQDAGIHTTGESNTFVGLLSGFSNTTGKENTFVGQNAGFSNTTGINNTFVGRYAGFRSTDRGNLVAVGDSALFNNGIGTSQLFHATNNTAVGAKAGYSNTTGDENTFVGEQAGFLNTTGNRNTFVGENANVSFINGDLDNSMALGSFSRVTASNTIAVGNTSITSIKGQVNFTTFSDERYKQNVVEDIPGLDFVLQLRPVTYQVDAHGIANFLKEDERGKKLKKDENEQASSKSRKAKQDGRDAKSRIRYTGFIAQEVEKAAHKVGFDFSGVDKPQNEHSLFGLRYAEFVVPLVKAVQEQQEIIEVQDDKIVTLEKNNQELEEGHQSQQQQIDQLKSLVEKLLADKEDTKGNSYILPLEQKPLLAQNQPNPFHHNTIVNYFIPGNVTNAKIQVTSVGGKVLGTLGIPEVGEGQVTIKAGTYPAGIYCYSLVLDGEVFETKRMVLTR